ncbi:MAG: hypothetical protein ACFFDN_46065 [Candidatus Hodarchaeota archaeon]
MRLSVEDTRTGKVIKLDVKEHHQIERIIDIVIKHMGIISVEQRSYGLVLHDKELPNSITIEEAIHKFGLKENDKLALWARVIGGYFYYV